MTLPQLIIPLALFAAFALAYFRAAHWLIELVSEAADEMEKDMYRSPPQRGLPIPRPTANPASTKEKTNDCL